MSDRVNEALGEVYAFLRQTGRVGITALLDEALATERATAAVDVELNQERLALAEARIDGMAGWNWERAMLVAAEYARLSGESES